MKSPFCIRSISFVVLIGIMMVFSTCKKDKATLFNTNLTYGTITDYDGNTYKTIQIGTQTWMAENLKAVKYNDGTAIPLISDGNDWATLSTPGCCWYNNDSTKYKATYGALLVCCEFREIVSKWLACTFH